MTGAGPKPSITRAAHLGVAAVSGLAVTVLEFAAVRFLAPSFGQSNYVWSNVIGIILLALALGYAVGGRIADRSTSARALYVAYLLAAAWAMGVGWLGRELCAWLAPSGLGNERLLPLAFTGSLVATIVLFAPPVLVLGMTSPFLIRLDHAPDRTGRTAGRIFAAGTLGSLLGCYLAPLWLLQSVGSRATIWLSALALALLALGGLALGRRRSRAGAPAALALAVAAVASSWAAQSAPLRRDAGQLVEIESAYQVIRVVEDLAAPRLEEGEWPLYGETVTTAARFLRHDEDVDDYQSVVLWPPEQTAAHLVGGRYYDHLALGAWFARPAPPSTPRRLRVLVIGYAAGAVHRALVAALPPDARLEVLGLEIDPAVVAAGREWLALGELEGPTLELVTGEDARTVLNALPAEGETFDLVLVDAYAQTRFVPFQLASRECFGLLARHLAPGGWIGVNLHAAGGLDGPLVRAIATTVAASPGIGGVWIVPNPLYRGSLCLWAAPTARPPRVRGDLPLPQPLASPAHALERYAVRHDPARDGGHVLTDDTSDAERLAGLGTGP